MNGEAESFSKKQFANYGYHDQLFQFDQLSKLDKVWRSIPSLPMITLFDSVAANSCTVEDDDSIKSEERD